MSSKLTLPQIDSVLKALAMWLHDNSDNVADDLAVEASDAPGIIVADVTPGDVQKGSAVLAVFTAKAALRKVATWFNHSTEWNYQQKQEFLTPMLAELQDAVNNCNAALHHLTGPGSGAIRGDPTLESFLNGGEK